MRRIANLLDKPGSRRGHPLPQALFTARVDRALPQGGDGGRCLRDTFEMVVFSSYKVK